MASSYKCVKIRRKSTYFKISYNLILIISKPENLLNNAKNTGILDTIFDVGLRVFGWHFLSDLRNDGELLNGFQTLVRSKQIQQELYFTALKENWSEKFITYVLGFVVLIKIGLWDQF